MAIAKCSICSMRRLEDFRSEKWHREDSSKRPPQAYREILGIAQVTSPRTNLSPRSTFNGAFRKFRPIRPSDHFVPEDLNRPDKQHFERLPLGCVITSNHNWERLQMGDFK